MKIIEGNLLDQTPGVLCHQVNLRGVMGAGLALQVRQKWPSAHDDYIRHCRYGCALGDVIFSAITGSSQVVAHCFGQVEMSRTKCVTAYDAYPFMLQKIAEESRRLLMPVFIPHGIGCGIAGGNWERMRDILETNIPEATIVRFVP